MITVYNLEVEDDHTYVANGFIVHNCMSCIAKHGQVFPLEEEQRDHWNGRCSQIPVTKSWEELGFEGIEDTRPAIQTGEEWFNALPESAQRERMGRSKFHAWKAGDIKLGDLSVAHDDPIFGKMFQEASLKELLGAKDARAWYAKAAQIEHEATP